MKTTHLILTGLFSVLLLNPVAGRADDIDIYSGLAVSSSLPNVLIVLDNAANFDASAPACSYTDTATAPTLSGKTGGIEQCALNNVLYSLGTNSDGTAKVNVGIMIYNASGFNTLFGCNSSATGGCLMVPLTAMNAAGKSAILAKIKSWSVTGSTSMKSNNEADASTMQEAWAYYAGKTGMSGTTYTSPASSTCQKNFAIFISNAFNNSGTPGDASQAPGTVLTNTVNSNTALTSTQQTIFKSTITIPAGSYGTSSFSCGSYSMGTHSDSSGLYADEWARYMYQTDLSTGSATTVEKNIISYGIGVLATSCKPDWPALLTSMARYGGGKYFATSSYNDVVNAILKILNEVQAVNSVFASSSLPVSVNAQGTFLNQIYMGMFRPDAAGLPRWVGNLKQYQFCYNTTTQTLYLCDSLGQDAINGAGTGFISPNAVSFWTSKNSAVEPDLNGGFWRNLPQGAGGGYDSPDGELVEKGGAAQVVRLANLMDDYTATAGTSTNPRNVYTYCPAGSSCNATLSNSANAFSITNSAITAGMFGASNISVKSIVRTGTSALVTTNFNHGFVTGDTVTISGATQPEYNVTQNVTVNSANSFTITGLPDLPSITTVGTFQASLHSVGQTVSTITRSSSSTSTANTETATVTTAAAHGFSTGNSVNITGATPSNYSGIKTIASVPSSTTFTFSVPVYPTASAVNSYTAVRHPFSGTITNITKFGVITTSSAPSFHVGQVVTIAGTTDAYFAGTWTLTAVSATTVTISTIGNHTSTAGTISPSSTPATISTLSRTGTTVAAIATATGLAASDFANGDQVDITTTGTAPNEGAYVVSAATITCSGTCTTFTYPIAVTPALSASGTMQVSLSVAPVAIPAGQITRSGTTATVTGVTNTFLNGNSVDISTSGTVYTAESAYTGTWTIACPISCSTSFTFGPVTLTPATPATGAIAAFSATATPNKTSLMNWVRGKDNLCDEASPDTGCPNQTTINIRPSLHGDVLHSRPTVINYGGTIGVVVYYGANDGVYHAVNGNQTNPTGSTLPAPGSELWSFIPPEFYGELARIHDNSPVLKLSTTPSGITPTPRKKDYFVDGSTSVYQKMNSDGTTNTAYLYLSMRRGGMFLYALDVTSPNNPTFLWKKSSLDTDFDELGQTWSQPKVAFVKGYANPVLIFGAGYDSAEDSELPGTDTMGRGIFIVDALDGHMVWHAQPSCSGAVAPCQAVAAMTYSISSDITLMDRSGNDGYIDRLYAADTGGNIWRVDLEPTAGNTPDKWQVTKLAALGCDTGACASGTIPRKFFYPADMVPTNSFDAVLIGSGDREHPLSTSLSYGVTNRFYMVKDPNTGNDGSSLTIPLNESDLVDITSTLAYDNSLNGYYITLGTSEKVVNAPLTVAGYTYFGTNTPTTSSASCTSNLGIAKGYRVKPLTGTTNYVVYYGGGLPPSPVAGSVDVIVNGVETVLPFCIGCGGNPDCVGADCKTAIGGGKPPINVSTSRSRTYWYKESD